MATATKEEAAKAATATKEQSEKTANATKTKVLWGLNREEKALKAQNATNYNSATTTNKEKASKTASATKEKAERQANATKEKSEKDANVIKEKASNITKAANGWIFYSGMYLKGFPSDLGKTYFDSLKAAQNKCLVSKDCGGVTKSGIPNFKDSTIKFKWSPRQGTTALKSSSGEDSWKKSGTVFSVSTSCA